MWQASEGEGEGKDEPVKSEKIGRGRIACAVGERGLECLFMFQLCATHKPLNCY